MTRVFVRVSYEVFNMPGFFTQFHELVGPFQIEQDIQESLDKRFRIWFFTDKVEIKEGESRQVQVNGLRQEDNDGKILFSISK